jgi:GMP synthase (glutamine-hydrolysing)
MKTAVAIRHVNFEDLGSFEPVLKRAGYQIYYLDAGLHDLRKLNPVAADILFVLGAPIGVYDGDLYPFLADEFALLKARLAARKPTLGICLGAQLIAAALGGRVYPSGGKEVGFAKVGLTEAGRYSPLRFLEDVEVLHWHGDTFDLPEGVAHLAATEMCPHQAFSLGKTVLGLQFHPEVEAIEIERWLIGHACELAGAKIDPRTIRADAERFGPALASAASAMLLEWLERLGEGA